VGVDEKSTRRRRPGPQAGALRIPDPDTLLLRNLGAALKEVRGASTVGAVASRANCTPETLAQVEAGALEVTLGHFRRILADGYGTTLRALLPHVLPESHPFALSAAYQFLLPGIILRDGAGRLFEEPTPLLIGGDRTTFRWAVPLHTLPQTSLMPEFHQFEKGYGTDFESHPGEEIICLLKGSLEVHYCNGPQKERDPHVAHLRRSGYAIHYDSSRAHSVRALETTAVFMLVRPSPSRS